jgi:major vault protein
VHYAVAVPKGEGRYVLDREKGEVRLVKGPVMLLPDPRKEVIVRRVLDLNQVALWYPGNTTAIEVNRRLKSELEATGAESQPIAMRGLSNYGERSADAFAGDALNRGTTYNQPRTVTLDTKYDGAPGIGPFPGFAVLVVNKSGDRAVVEGPAAILLEYDQSLMPFELSTGTPKTDFKTKKDVYLQVKNNRVSDKVVGVETKDLVPVDVTVAYRVNFEGDDPLKWFQVDNYVRHLTEHARSILRNAVKQVGIEEFYKNPIVIIRDAILGKQVDGAERKGLVFKENAMRVYDVDVLEITIQAQDIAGLLEGAQLQALKSTLQVAAKERELDTTTRIEGFERQIAEEKATTTSAKVGFEIDQIKRQLEKSLANLESQNKQEEERLKAEQGRQGTIDSIDASVLARQKAEEEQRLALTKQQIEQELAKLAQETEEIVKRADAVDDKLIAALQAFADKDLMAKTAEAMAPLAIFRNSGVVEVFAGLLKGTPLADVLNRLQKH